MSEKHPNIELIFNLQELFQIICLTNKWKPALFYVKRKPEEKNRERKEKTKKIKIDR